MLNADSFQLRSSQHFCRLRSKQLFWFAILQVAIQAFEPERLLPVVLIRQMLQNLSDDGQRPESLRVVRG